MPPSPDSYGRVTNPQRYAVLHDEARSLIERLLTTFDVIAAPGEVGIDFPEWKGSPGEVIRLAPMSGTPLAFLFTDFPGVLVRLGEWGVEAFPACGCDACDEQPNDVIIRMREAIESAVAGEYEETLIRGWLRKGWLSFAGPGIGSGTRRLGPGEGRPWQTRKPSLATLATAVARPPTPRSGAKNPYPGVGCSAKMSS